MSDPLINTHLGKYQIQHRLGDGGMGSVYLALDTELRRDVAIKVMHPHFARKTELRRRFQLEAQAMAQLSHAGIVQVYDSGHQAEWFYIVMEFIRGGNLQDMLDGLRSTNQWIPLADALQLVKQLALALKYAHGNRILHRDIKPANVMMRQTSSDELLQPIITDLGLAKLEASVGITSTGKSVGGTPAYMSPEQSRGDNVDQRSDVYSLGVLLFELVCRERPFSASTLSQALKQHNEQPPPLPESLRPDIPKGVAAIILKALEKDPNQRFSSAAAMAAAIDRLSTTSLLSTVPPTAVAGASSIQTLHQQSLVRQRGHSIMDDFPSLVSSDAAVQVLYPDGQSKEFMINQRVFSIGRDEHNDLVLNDEKISREHARIETNGVTFDVTDLGSANGTFLGNSRLLSNVPEPWNTEQALQIGGHHLRLVPAKSQSDMGTRVEQAIAVHGVNLFLNQSELLLQPGDTASLPVVLMNLGEQVAHFNLSVDGIPTEWVRVPAAVELMPGDSRELAITLQSPQATGSQGGTYTVSVRATNQDSPQQSALRTLKLTLAAQSSNDLGSSELEGSQLHSLLLPQNGRSGEPMQVELRNQGSVPQMVMLDWSGNQEKLDFQPQRGTSVTVAPGAIETITFTPSTRERTLIGVGKKYPLNVQVTSTNPRASQNLTGTVKSHGLVPIWASSLLLGLLAVMIAGFVYNLSGIDPTTDPSETPTPTATPTQVPNDTQPLTTKPTVDEMNALPWIWTKPAFENFFVPGTEQIAQTVRDNEEWIMHGGWCSTTQDLLLDNLSNVQVDLIVDGVTVSDSNILEYSLQQGGEECVMMATKLSNWPATATVEVEAKYRLATDVDDGTDVYKAGEYRHLATLSIDHAPTSMPAEDPMLPQATRPSTDDISTVPSIWTAKLNFQNILVPSTEQYLFSTTPDAEWMWSIGWCAVTADVLTENLSGTQFQLIVGGTPVPESKILKYPYQENGDECMAWMTKLAKWPADSTVEIEALYSLSKDTNDGRAEYVAGSYRHAVTVTVN